jgi:hypothetical protein
VWKKDRSKGATVVLRDYWLDRGIEPEPEFERLKREVEHDIRREQVEATVGEEGNLEREPWAIGELSPEAPYRGTEFVPIDISRRGRTVTVTVAVRVAGDDDIYSVTVLDHGHPRRLQPDEYPFPIDSTDRAELLRTARERVPAQLPPVVVSPDGEELWLARESQRGLWMDYPPEYLTQQLERGYGTGPFRTVYDDGGGYGRTEPDYLLDLETKDLWHKIEEGHGRDEGHECPLKDWNGERGEDERDRLVTVEDTYYGEYPNKSCRYCEENIGEEHGYMGTVDTTIFMQVVAEALPSTIDESHIEDQIIQAFENSDRSTNADLSTLQADYEHGHWWITVDEYLDEDRSGRDMLTRRYSVVDTDRGFDFEEV